MRSICVACLVLASACADEDFGPHGPVVETSVVVLTYGNACEARPGGRSSEWARTPRLVESQLAGFVDLTIDWSAPRSFEHAAVSDLCFSMEVTRADGRMVDAEARLCVSTYGASTTSGQGLTFVARCDAGTGTEDNRVTVRGVQACDADGRTLRAVELPCADGCSQVFTCRADEDARVDFDL